MLHLAAWVACQELSLELGGDEGLLGVLAAGSAVLIAVGDLGCGAVQRKFNFSMLRGRVRGQILNGHPFCLPELGSLHYNVCLSLVVISWLYKQSSHRVHCGARLCDWTKGRSALLLLKEQCGHVYIYIYVCVYIYIYVCVCVYICVYIYMCVYIYIYIMWACYIYISRTGSFCI